MLAEKHLPSEQIYWYLASSNIGKKIHTYSAIYREPKPNGKLMLRHRKRSKYLGDDSTTTTKVSFQLDRKVSHKHHLRSAKKTVPMDLSTRFCQFFANALLLRTYQPCSFSGIPLCCNTHLLQFSYFSPLEALKELQHRISQRALCVWEKKHHH